MVCRMRSEFIQVCGRGQSVKVATPLQEVRLSAVGAGLNRFESSTDFVPRRRKNWHGCMNVVAVIAQYTWVPVTLT